MAPIQEIQYWLTEKTPYSYGVQLLSQVLNNHRLITNLQRRETQKNLEKVEYELNKFLLDNHKLVENAEEKIPKKEFYSSESEGIQSESKPEIVAEPNRLPKKVDFSTIPGSNRSNDLASNQHDLVDRVKKDRAILYRQRGHYHGRLHESLSEDDRLSLARKIMKLQKEIDQVNSELERIEKGETPRSYLLKMMSGDEYKRYRNFQSYVNRYQKKLKNKDLPEDKRVIYQEKLDEYQSKLDSFF